MKLKEEEITVLKKLMEEKNSITFMLGDAKMQKLMIEKVEKEIEKEWEELRMKESEFLNKIKESYGNIQIDTETFEYTLNK